MLCKGREKGNVVYALLLASSQKNSEQFEISTKIYAQKVQGLNNPILKTMCSGPLLRFDNRKDEDHWKFVHYDDDAHCNGNQDLHLHGPASIKDTSIVHPCNLGTCWNGCTCSLCQHARQIKCKNHKNHLKFNMKKCIIQEIVQCQDHWLDHPENFDKKEDVKIDHHEVLVKGEVQKHCRNKRLRTVEYAGLKKSCRKCRQNTKDHASEHLVPHMQCKHCLYELKTSDESNFWNRVCKICGKLFDSEGETKKHMKGHNSNVHVCCVCGLVCSTKFNLRRHILEQDDCFQNTIDKFSKSSVEAKKEFACTLCENSYKQERNLDEHIKKNHGSSDNSKFPCKVCGYKFTFDYNLKVHMTEQHGITEFDDCVISKEAKMFACPICGVVFQRNSNLKAHELTHTNQEKFKCDMCGKQFTAKTSLNRHRKVHVVDRPQFDCERCGKSFLSKGSLSRHLSGIHRI